VVSRSGCLNPLLLHIAAVQMERRHATVWGPL